MLQYYYVQLKTRDLTEDREGWYSTKELADKAVETFMKKVEEDIEYYGETNYEIFPITIILDEEL